MGKIEVSVLGTLESVPDKTLEVVIFHKQIIQHFTRSVFASTIWVPLLLASESFPLFTVQNVFQLFVYGFGCSLRFAIVLMNVVECCSSQFFLEFWDNCVRSFRRNSSTYLAVGKSIRLFFFLRCSRCDVMLCYAKKKQAGRSQY